MTAREWALTDKLERLEAAVLRFARGLATDPWVDGRVREQARGLVKLLDPAVCTETLDADARCAKCGWNGRTKTYDLAPGEPQNETKSEG